MDYTFYRQIHNNNILNMSLAKLGIIITIAVLYLVYNEVNENNKYE